MPLSLEQAKLDAPDAISRSVLDQFRVSPLMDLIQFDNAVAPTGGGTFVYGYDRVVTPSQAQFRAINAEYAPTEASKERHTTELKILGGAFQVDRQLAKIGTGAQNTVTFQLEQKIKATRNQFADAVINGDTGQNPDAFDGLSKALADSSTELADGTYDWSAGLTVDTANSIMDDLDDILGNIDGEPTMIIANKRALNKIKAVLRRTSQWTQTPGPLNTMRDTYGNITLVEAGKNGTEDIIPVDAGKTDIYAVRADLAGFHGVSTLGGHLLSTYLPDFDTPGAVKTGEVELGPVGVVLKDTRAAVVARGVKIA